VQSKLHDVEKQLRGILRGFGIKVGKTTELKFAGRIEETGGGPSASSGARQGAAGGAAVAEDRSSKFSEAGTQGWRATKSEHAADVDAAAARSCDELCQRDRRSRAVQIVESRRSPFGLTDEVSIRRDRTTPAGSDKIGDSSCAHGARRGRPCQADEDVKGCSQLKRWAMRIARRAGMRKAKVARRAGSR